MGIVIWGPIFATEGAGDEDGCITYAPTQPTRNGRVGSRRSRHESKEIYHFYRAAGLLAANELAAAAAPKVVLAKPVLMKVGDQTAPTNETHLKYLARYSVRNICGYPEIEGDRLYATVEELNRMVDLAGQMRHQHRLHRASISGVQSHRQRKASGHHAGAKSGAGPRYRIPANHDQELRPGGYPLH